MEWLINAGVHPKANSTTLAVAQDLATRMDYDTGHARYCLEDTAARLGVDRSTVKRHVAVLREMGSLAWVVHGTRRNIRAVLGMKGYAATATVYAAVIPAVYDHAMGHRIVGTGYTARVVIDQRDQQNPVDNPPVDNPASGSCAPPSLSLVNEEGKIQMGGGFNYTPRERASRTTAASPSLPSTNKDGSSKDGAPRRSPLQVAQDIRIARRVRALVTWTQKEGLRRLAYVLRPLIDRGLDGDAIASELDGMCLGWTPKKPAAYIRTALALEAARLAEQAADQERRDSAAWRHQNPEDVASLQRLFGLPEQQEEEPVRTDYDRRMARLNWNNWIEVINHYEEDPDDALDLYGTRLIAFAIGKDCQAKDRQARQEAWV
ncbi:cell wall protein [Streptomyces sp. Wb2n-11]|uniref:cell wall protein n=1 Tax=Streptomyces sp. Wb2n-11 TaxID=1030533 RepID=UPI00159ECBDD|nr:cell wall protein [Streptomyces sp. Wb2n-11]